MIVIQNYINGKFESSENIIEDINPATGEVIAHIPKSTLNEVETAVNAADLGRDNWANLSLEERTVWLDKIANVLESKSEEIASLESLDTGKPISLARAVDASRSVTNFRFFCRICQKL